MPRECEVRMIDIAEPEQQVEVLADSSAGGNITLWVNVDGICRLRVTAIKNEILVVDLTGVNPDTIEVREPDRD